MPETLKILLIEDDEDDFVLARDLLTIAFPGGCNLEWIDDWNAGLEAIARNEHDVYLIDYRLGERDGVELVRLAVNLECKAPIIVLTGMNMREIDIQVMNAGAADYLVKDEISPSLLEKSIRYALTRQRFLKREVEVKHLLREKNRRLSELFNTAHQFVDNVSHEFRTPLTVIKEFTSILADGLAGGVNDEQREYLNVILNRVDDLSLMVNDMLDISRLEGDLLGVFRQECSVEGIVGQIKILLERKAAASKVAFGIAIDDALPNVYCDAEKIGRVVVNLAINAFKFSRESGEVSVWARHDVDRSQVIVGVTDNGVGIAAENFQAIFERFQQIGGNMRFSNKGFGLGLNIAKELVQLNFGDIEVESELGKGSTFSFTVPTFDPPKILVRFMKRIERYRNGCAYVSLVGARITPTWEGTILDDMERFLQQQVRHNDLVFRARAGTWLICAATNQQELEQMIARIGKSQTDANRNRPGGEWPEIEFSVGGTWRVRDEGAEFVRRFEAARARQFDQNFRPAGREGGDQSGLRVTT